MAIKVFLGLGGVFFLVLGVAILTYQASTSMQEAFLFLGIGIGCFFGLDWYNARQPRRSSLKILEDEESSPETEKGSRADEDGEDDFTESRGGGGGGGASVNHLEQAEILFQKIVATPNEGAVASLVEKGLEEVGAKGYSEKGITAFLNKLGGSLAAMTSQQFSEQAMKNRSVAMATLAKLRNVQSAS